MKTSDKDDESDSSDDLGSLTPEFENIAVILSLISIVFYLRVKKEGKIVDLE